jgi:hypothetical protein
MATDSFTSSAHIVTGTSAIFSVPSIGQGDRLFSRNGFSVRINPTGVYITKAPALGGVQAPLTFPLSRYDAVELATLLLTLTD